MARKDKYRQGDDAGAIIEFILRRKDAYYQANVTQRARAASEAIKACLDQRFTPEEEDLTRSKFFLSSIINSYDAMNEVHTQAYGMAQKLIVFNTKRKGTSELAERGEWLMANVQEEAEFLSPWLAQFRDIAIYGNGVSYQHWDFRRGKGVGIQQARGPWGVLGSVALQDKTLWDRPFAKRVHPYDWFGYWRQADNLPWEGLQHEWGACEFGKMLEDEDWDYQHDGIKYALERLKKGSGPKDEYGHQAEDEDNEDIPDANTLQGYEYFGDLYGCPGHEKDSQEYHVLITDMELLLKSANEIAGYRPIKRPKGVVMNDWCGGRPLLLPQVPALKMENFFANSMIDDVSDRLYAGWAMWEDAMQNPDDFLNPEGIGAPIRMAKGADAKYIPTRIGGGQSGIQADVQRINDTILEKDRQSGNFQDVMSQKGGIQDGTARAANLIASQGARKMQSIQVMANETGLVPICEQLLLLKFIHTPPEQMSKQTRDGKEFGLSLDEMGMLLERNLWTFNDSFRRDPILDEQNMERFAKAGGVEFMVKHAADPMIPAEFWREFARTLNLRNYDRWIPLEMPQPQQPQGGGLPPELAGQPPGPDFSMPEFGSPEMAGKVAA